MALDIAGGEFRRKACCGDGDGEHQHQLIEVCLSRAAVCAPVRVYAVIISGSPLGQKRTGWEERTIHDPFGLVRLGRPGQGRLPRGYVPLGMPSVVVDAG